ncbi:MAG TPA: DUF2269 family protein [Gaiellaceae bacterium]|jgi:uncharacterized membrane protein|nr:DUF2269 family protein [Gaiellaceae bacterium]
MTTTPATSPRSSLVPTALIGLAFLIVAIVFLSGSEWYIGFKTVHVLFVVVWVGGGAAITILGLKAERATDGAEVTGLARQAAFLGERVFAPSGLVVVATGIGMVSNASLGYDHFWIGFGLLGFLATFVIGIAILSPRAKKLVALVESKGPNAPETRAAVGTILLIARADMALLLLVIIDMVAKPFS